MPLGLLVTDKSSSGHRDTKVEVEQCGRGLDWGKGSGEDRGEEAMPKSLEFTPKKTISQLRSSEFYFVFFNGVPHRKRVFFFPFSVFLLLLARDATPFYALSPPTVYLRNFYFY